MARTTVYTLYKTGRTDPTFTHIWGFDTLLEREVWLAQKPLYTFSRQKYWRVGNPIKIPISYENSFGYDYIKLVNDSGTAQERIWYCFVTARAYVSPNVTMLTLETDFIQTFYFNDTVNGSMPFWDCTGFIERTTAHITPLVGTPGDFPVVQSKTEHFEYESGDYAFIIFSTFDPSTAAQDPPTYSGSITAGVYSAVAPYVVGGANAGAALNTVITAINTAGLTDGIAGIYAVPSRFILSAQLDGSVHALTNVNDLHGTINPVLHSTYEYSYLLDNYDYSYYVINNGQGETQIFYRWEFTNGVATFDMKLSVAGGCPTIFLIPTNLIYGNADAAQQRSMKITQGMSCVYLNDNYKIWLAQSRFTRQASLDGANLAIAQAEEARSKSWAYAYGGAIESVVGAAQGPVVSALDSIINGVETPNAISGETSDGVPIFRELTTEQAASKLSFSTGVKGLLNPGASTRTERISVNTLNAAYVFAERYLYNQLGIETRYTFDHAVANAQQSLNQLVASWKDKARIPATARGSSTGGDMALLRQYGFMISYFSPAPEIYAQLNMMISASGHTVNKYELIYREHDVFDYYKVNSAKIGVNADVRPEFVRKMMLDILQRGVYLWYYTDGDISPFFGSPYGLTNPVYDDGGNG